MKTIVSLLFVASATAFAPSASTQHQQHALKATAELDNMLGVDIETGKKIVRT